MTARIVGFVTRAQAGLVGPKSVSRNITPAKGGVAPHYGGPHQPAAEPGSDHAKCVATWRNWQKYHMGTKGWADIAYTGGFCNHGYAFAGRGAGVRTAANGTNDGNQRFYAVTFIGGEGQALTPQAIDALEWWVRELRLGGAGREVRPHRYFKPTGCPGDPLVHQAARLHNRDIAASSEPTPAPSRPVLRLGSKGPAVEDLQRLLHIKVDGDFGPNTDKSVRAFQAAANLTVDGVVGKNTWLALEGSKPAPAPAPIPAPTPPAPTPTVEDGLMHLLVKSDTAAAVFAVRPGVWRHVSPAELGVLRKTGVCLHGGNIVTLTEGELSSLKTFYAPE